MHAACYVGDEPVPPFGDVVSYMEMRIEQIVSEAGADEYELFISQGPYHRHDIAVTKPYKGNRTVDPPWHLINCKAYAKGVLNATWEQGWEADDLIGCVQGDATIICSIDKDLRQIPGWHYRWETFNSDAIPPTFITRCGDLTFDDGKLRGSGYLWFAAQVLAGDAGDNIPGLPGCGPARAYRRLKNCTSEEEAEAVFIEALEEIGDGYLEEQANLVWLARRRNPDDLSLPQLWSPGLFV